MQTRSYTIYVHSIRYLCKPHTYYFDVEKLYKTNIYSPPPKVKPSWRNRFSITVYASAFNLVRKSKLLGKSPEPQAKYNPSLTNRFLNTL